MYRNLLLLFFILNINLGGLSASNIYNSDKKVNGIAINFYSGYLQYHHLEMWVLKEHRASAIELTYAKQVDGSKLWHSVYRNPNYGISYKFMDLGSSNILGFSHCFYPFIDIPLLKPNNRFSTDLHLATGIAYIPKTYQPQSNPLNSAISTHLNVYIDLGLLFSIRLMDILWLKGGVHITHFSNGSFKKPNYGLNYTLASFGLQYTYKGNTLAKNDYYPYLKELNRFIAIGAGSVKEAIGIGGNKYGVATGSLEYSYPVGMPLFRLGASLDFMYDGSNALILDNSGLEWGSDWQLFKLGTALTSEFIFDKLSLMLYFGGYYHNLSRQINNQWVYQRLALRYRTGDRIWFHIALKTHWNIADYIEFGVAAKLF
jgi:hypothetical protein